MDNVQDVKGTGQDAYKHQKIYEEKKAKNKIILGWIFFAMSIFSLVSVFIFPLYKFNLIDNKANLKIVGNFTAVKMISEYFSKGFGDYSLLSTGLMLSTVLILVAMVYMIAASVFAVILKGKTSGFLKKMTSFTALEIVSTIQFILLIINMITTKVQVSGNAENGTEFWIVFILSFLMVCFSISLSTPNHTEE